MWWPISLAFISLRSTNNRAFVTPLGAHMAWRAALPVGLTGRVCFFPLTRKTKPMSPTSLMRLRMSPAVRQMCSTAWLSEGLKNCNLQWVFNTPKACSVMARTLAWWYLKWLCTIYSVFLYDVMMATGNHCMHSHPHPQSSTLQVGYETRMNAFIVISGYQCIRKWV